MGKMVLQSNNVIEKRNILNEMRATQLSLVELRFLLVYLSKINARDMGTRTVRFPIADFVKILEIQKVNITAMKATASRLLSHVVSIPNTVTGGFTAFQLFKRCKVDKDENGDWYVDIDAHDEALPLMFDFKRDYFKYELWNALRLNSPQQVRMYEILKQYEHKGGRTVALDELRTLLGIEKDAYPLYATFRREILDRYRKILKDTTDIYYTYEPIRKAKGKVTAISFKVFKNEDFVDQLTIDEFINLQEDIEDEDVIGEALATDDQDENIFELLSGAFNGEFDLAQVEELYHIALPYIQNIHPKENRHGIQLKMHDYFMLKYAQLKAYSQPIRKSRFGLLRTFIKADAKVVSE